MIKKKIGCQESELSVKRGEVVMSCLKHGGRRYPKLAESHLGAVGR